MIVKCRTHFRSDFVGMVQYERSQLWILILEQILVVLVEPFNASIQVEDNSVPLGEH